MKIGLAFPELGEHKIGHFLNILEKPNMLDLVIFPEGFETISSNTITPENIQDSDEVKEISKKYSEICNRLNISIILGIQVDYGNVTINGQGNDQYCLIFERGGKNKVCYHKHSTSRFNAFFDNNWSIESNFVVFSIDNKKIGISICHDSYISLIPRVLKKKGAEIWVNISYQNVRPNMWESVLHTRAIENKFLSICTLHRNSEESNPQKEPYAFSEIGKLRLKDLETGSYLSEIGFENRTGKVYYFDSENLLDSYSQKEPQATELASNAEELLIQFDENKNLTVKDINNRYVIKELNLIDFIFSPEKIWKICLDNQKQIVLFHVILNNNGEWEKYRKTIFSIIKGRIIEFSTLFIFTDMSKKNIHLAAYRSSNYKDSRVFFPKKVPITIDKRYTKGLESTYKISLTDPRNKDNNENIYFERINQIIKFLQK